VNHELGARCGIWACSWRANATTARIETGGRIAQARRWQLYQSAQPPTTDHSNRQRRRFYRSWMWTRLDLIPVSGQRRSTIALLIIRHGRFVEVSVSVYRVSSFAKGLAPLGV
jgi:hypothetical protein